MADEATDVTNYSAVSEKALVCRFESAILRLVTSVSKDALLAALTAIGWVGCWWVECMVPSLDLPWWLPLAVAVLYPILSTILSRERWWLFLLASAIGTIGGIISGFTIWPPDPLIWEGAVYVVIPLAAGFILLALVLGLTSRVSMSDGMLRRILWITLVCSVAFGPTVLFLTTPLVAKRVARNDELAAERFASLKSAVEQTKAEAGGMERICDGKTLKQHYSGPPFSDTDWRYIAGNSVREDGYHFGIFIYCPQPDAYVVEAAPIRESGDGTRRFCADNSGMVGCELGTREECLPCTK